MVVKLYHDLASPPVRAVLFTIKNLNIPVEIVDLNLLKGDNKSEEYLQINPHGSIPAIDDDGVFLLDSHAINIYLTTKYPGGEKLYPSDPVKRAIINERLFYEAGELFATVKSVVKKMIFQNAPGLDAEAIERFETAYKGAELYLKNSQYIAGDSLSIADFSFITTLGNMNEVVRVKKEKFPVLVAYMERAQSWPFYAEIQEAGVKKVLGYFKLKNIPILPN